MGRSPRKREESPDRRAQILDQAIRAIGERGYYGFTVHDLAQRCGMSNPGLLHYFPSKTHLLLAVLSELEQREAEVMKPLVAAVEAGDAEARKAAVLAVLRAMMARGRAEPELGRLLAALKTEALDPAHPAHAWWGTRSSALLDLLVQLVGDYDDDPTSLARQLLATMDGLGLQWRQADYGFDLLAEWDRALARLLPALHGAGAFGPGAPPNVRTEVQKKKGRN